MIVRDNDAVILDITPKTWNGKTLKHEWFVRDAEEWACYSDWDEADGHNWKGFSFNTLTYVLNTYEATLTFPTPALGRSFNTLLGLLIEGPGVAALVPNPAGTSPEEIVELTQKILLVLHEPATN